MDHDGMKSMRYPLAAVLLWLQRASAQCTQRGFENFNRPGNCTPMPIGFCGDSVASNYFAPPAGDRKLPACAQSNPEAERGMPLPKLPPS
jgi:hypothetical protein